MVVFSVGDIVSFQSLPTWLNNLEMKATDPNLSVVIVGNKCDLKGADRQVDREEAERFCKQRNLRYAETSALENENVTEAFDLLIDLVLAKQVPNDSKAEKSTVTLTANSSAAPKQEGGCCN
jgi:GTPase SAR1 family protein